MSHIKPFIADYLKCIKADAIRNESPIEKIKVEPVILYPNYQGYEGQKNAVDAYDTPLADAYDDIILIGTPVVFHDSPFGVARNRELYHRDFIVSVASNNVYISDFFWNKSVDLIAWHFRGYRVMIKYKE